MLHRWHTHYTEVMYQLNRSLNNASCQMDFAITFLPCHCDAGNTEHSFCVLLDFYMAKIWNFAPEFRSIVAPKPFDFAKWCIVWQKLFCCFQGIALLVDKIHYVHTCVIVCEWQCILVDIFCYQINWASQIAMSKFQRFLCFLVQFAGPVLVNFAMHAGNAITVLIMYNFCTFNNILEFSQIIEVTVSHNFMPLTISVVALFWEETVFR